MRFYIINCVNFSCLVVVPKKIVFLYSLAFVILLFGALLLGASTVSRHWRVNEGVHTKQIDTLAQRMKLVGEGDHYVWGINHGLFRKCLRPDNERILAYLKLPSRCEVIRNEDAPQTEEEKQKSKLFTICNIYSFIQFCFYFQSYILIYN